MQSSIYLSFEIAAYALSQEYELSQRNVLTALFHLQELTDAHNWLMFTFMAIGRYPYSE